MFFRKSKLIQKLKEQIAYLIGRLEESEKRAEGYRSIAERALEVANENTRDLTIRDLIEMAKRTPRADLERMQDALWRSPSPPESSLPNYKAPEVKNCPECCVSVRAEAWPQECPSCHVTFGFGETE